MRKGDLCPRTQGGATSLCRKVAEMGCLASVFALGGSAGKDPALSHLDTAGHLRSVTSCHDLCSPGQLC